MNSSHELDNNLTQEKLTVWKLIFIFIDWQGYIHNIHQFYIFIVQSSFSTGNPDEFGKPLNERRPFLPRCRRHAHLLYAGCNKIIIMVKFGFYHDFMRF